MWHRLSHRHPYRASSIHPPTLATDTTAGHLRGALESGTERQARHHTAIRKDEGPDGRYRRHRVRGRLRERFLFDCIIQSRPSSACFRSP